MKLKSTFIVLLFAIAFNCFSQIKTPVAQVKNSKEVATSVVAKDTAKIAVCDSMEKDSCTVAQAEKGKITSEEKMLLLGNVDWYVYKVAFLFIFMGMLLRFFITVPSGIKNSTMSPDKFSMSYYLKANLLSRLFSIFASIIISFIVIRFSNEFFGITFNSYTSMLSAFFIGFFFDWVADYLKKISPESVLAKKITGQTNIPAPIADDANAPTIDTPSNN